MKFETLFDLSDWKYQKQFEDCQNPWDPITKLISFFESASLGEIETIVPEGAFLISPELISIGKGTLIEPGAYIKGPCLIGENCSIRQGAYIRGHFVCGDECVIGHATEVKNSIFLNRANAAHFAYVGDSILGNRTNLGAGTILANLRFDGKNVSISIDGKKVDTGLRKLGALIGDGAQTGCHTVTNPGTILLKGGVTLPTQSVGGVVKTKLERISCH